MQHPLISIVICCHNRAHMLPQTLESVFAQSYRPFEVVVLDDGSTDCTRQLMQTYGERLRYHFQPNQGVAHARTNAARLARGTLIAFQDDDDLMAPDRLEILHDALASHPECSFAVGNLEVIGQEDTLDQLLDARPDSAAPAEVTLFADGYEAVLWPHVPATNHTTLFRKVDGDRINWFDPRYTIGAEDKDFFARLGKLGSVVHVAKTVSYYRRGHASLSAEQFFSYYVALLLFQTHLRELLAPSPAIRERLRRRILFTLKAMATLRSRGVPRPARVPAHYLTDALAFLKTAEKIDYRFKAHVTAPLKALLR